MTDRSLSIDRSAHLLYKPAKEKVLRWRVPSKRGLEMKLFGPLYEEKSPFMTESPSPNAMKMLTVHNAITVVRPNTDSYIDRLHSIHQAISSMKNRLKQIHHRVVRSTNSRYMPFKSSTSAFSSSTFSLFSPSISSVVRYLCWTSPSSFSKPLTR